MKKDGDLREMVMKINKGDDETIDNFFHLYDRWIIRAFQCRAPKNCGNDQEKEFLQTCHIALIHAMRNFKGYNNPVFHAYCNKIIDNSLKDFIKREKKYLMLSLDYRKEDDIELKDIIADKENLEETVIFKLDFTEKFNLIFKFKLTADEKKLVIALKNDVSIKEYANEEGISYATARKRKERIRKKIKKLLEGNGPNQGKL